MSTKPDYEVGRGKPPKGTQFKKGQSGNPGGRPKAWPATSMQYRLRDAIEEALASNWLALKYQRDEWETVNDPLLRLARDLVVESADGRERARKVLLSLMEKLDRVKMNENENRPESLSLRQGTAEGSTANPPVTGEKNLMDQPVSGDASEGSGNSSGKEAARLGTSRPPHQKPIIPIGGRVVQDGH
jgi:hypothetical protein